MSIALENVSYIYGAKTPFEKQALTEITTTIEEGEFVGIIGHTGSGKSTFVQHLNGLLTATTGKVTVDGIDLSEKTEAAKRARHSVGMVFQYPEHQLFEETIAKDIAFGPSNLGLSPEDIDERVRDAMALVGLDYDTYASRSPFQLSGGQMRRVAIAGVIAMRPKYLILDEPSAGLDPFGRNEIFSQIMELHRRGTTVIFVSHNMEDVSKMATRLLVFEGGRILLDGKPLDIFINKRAELQGAGVDAPPVSVLLDSLEARGLAVNKEAVTVKEAADHIVAAYREVHHAD